MHFEARQGGTEGRPAGVKLRICILSRFDGGAALLSLDDRLRRVFRTPRLEFLFSELFTQVQDLRRPYASVDVMFV